MNIYFRTKKAIKDANISIDGRKRLSIKELDAEESVKQFHSAYMQEKIKEEFEYSEMQKKYPWQK